MTPWEKHANKDLCTFLKQYQTNKKVLNVWNNNLTWDWAHAGWLKEKMRKPCAGKRFLGKMFYKNFRRSGLNEEGQGEGESTPRIQLPRKTFVMTYTSRWEWDVLAFEIHRFWKGRHLKSMLYLENFSERDRSSHQVTSHSFWRSGT